MKKYESAENNYFQSSLARSHEYVRNALEKGTIEKPRKCLRCNEEKYLLPHHPNYDFPDKFVWLCMSCYRRIHVKIIEKSGKRFAEHDIKRAVIRLTENEHRSVKMHCIKSGISIQDFLVKLLKPYLRIK